MSRAREPMHVPHSLEEEDLYLTETLLFVSECLYFFRSREPNVSLSKMRLKNEIQTLLNGSWTSKIHLT